MPTTIQSPTSSTHSRLDHTDLRGFPRFTGWLKRGWQLFRRAPLGLFGLMILVFAVEAVIQWFAPIIGIPISKYVLALLTSLFWLILANLNETGRLQPVRALRGCGGKLPVLAVLAAVMFLAYGMQVACGYLILGPQAIDLLVFADLTEAPSLSSAQLALILSAGIPLSTLLMFAAPLMLIDELPLKEALVSSVSLVLRHAFAMTMLALLMIFLIAMGPFTLFLSVLLTGPWLLCVGFAAYQSMKAGSETAM
jgi:hypothetical protein